MIGVVCTSPNLNLVAAAIPALKRQMPFAESNAINETAKESQAWTTQSLLPEKFTLRAKGAPWYRKGTPLGFNIKFANRATLTAALGSKADWLSYQELAGTKKADEHRIAIPSKFWKRREEIMAKAKKPRALIRQMERLKRAEAGVKPEKGKRGRVTTRTRAAAKAQKNELRKQRQAISSLANTPFLSKGKLHPGIYVRTGKARLPIKHLFTFVKLAKMKRALNFEVGAEAKAISVYPKHMQQELARAIAFARLK